MAGTSPAMTQRTSYSRARPCRLREREHLPPRPSLRSAPPPQAGEEILPQSIRHRARPDLEVHRHRRHAEAAFLVPGHAVAAGGPKAAAFPADLCIVDAAVEALGVEAGRVGHFHGDHLAVGKGDQAVVEIAGRDRHVVAEAERVVLVDPGVIARLRRVIADAGKARPRIFVERPAFRALIAGCGRAVERPFAFAPVEAAEMAAGERHPDNAFGVDVAAARAEAGQRYIVDFRKRRLRRIGAGIEPYHRAGIVADRAPHCAVNRAWHYGVKYLADPHVLAGLNRFARLGVFAALAVAAGVDDQRRPALRSFGVAGL